MSKLSLGVCLLSAQIGLYFDNSTTKECVNTAIYLGKPVLISNIFTLSTQGIGQKLVYECSDLLMTWPSGQLGDCIL